MDLRRCSTGFFNGFHMFSLVFIYVFINDPRHKASKQHHHRSLGIKSAGWEDPVTSEALTIFGLQPTSLVAPGAL